MDCKDIRNRKARMGWDGVGWHKLLVSKKKKKKRKKKKSR